ncbi:MAG: RNA pseudouridine synthase [Deltaproteobacteria bacterium HGW-Deltaproteobacteria-6]|nr:MAG: RNA pseudouridine synthase [Deltaproteobacteria bacterium HGW-Deltaproteobacteria-6]
MQASQWPEKLSFVRAVTDDTSPGACDFLAFYTGLSKGRVKDAMNKGAVWLQRKGSGRIRLRKASFRLRKEDILELHYDPKLLSMDPPIASCLQDYKHYSVWFKPANLLSQGTDFGDHGSLLRQAETYFNPRREAFLVHRLDREAAGLMMVAHSKKAAGRLSILFSEHRVVKRYRVEVLGMPENNEGAISQPLDGKTAVTRYRIISRNPEADTSTLEVEIETGRLHQIRRHLACIGHPVMGDPRYGAGNKDGKPLRLTACELAWRCPFTGNERVSSLKNEEDGDRGPGLRQGVKA